MRNLSWPDPLQPAQPALVEALLSAFWQQLQRLPDLLNRQEFLLAEQLTSALRHTVLELMLALNGIAYPAGTSHLNSYLGESQRAAIQKTLLLPSVSTEGWIGQAVALVVIYRWYAPQLVDKFGLAYPHALEAAVWRHLQHELAEWPLTVETE